MSKRSFELVSQEFDDDMVQFSLDTVVILYTRGTVKSNAAWKLNDRGIGASLLTVSFSKSFLTWGQWCMVAQAPEWAGFESRRRAYHRHCSILRKL